MLRRLRKLAHDSVHDYRELKLVTELLASSLAAQEQGSTEANVIVSLTSYPARIRHAWRSVETILRQENRPDLTILVLSEDDFPRRDLPALLNRQRRRGLEVLWVKRNGRSFDKLIPVRKAFPDFTIITVDDDLYFPPSLVRELLDWSAFHPGSIIGSRGWRVLPSRTDGKVHFGLDWIRAERGDAGVGLHLPGGNGCLYPPGSLDAIVDDLDLALSLTPTNDDIWFWIQAFRAGTEFVCLGMPPHRRVTPQAKTPALSFANREGQQEQFHAILRYFDIEPSALAWVY